VRAVRNLAFAAQVLTLFVSALTVAPPAEAAVPSGGRLDFTVLRDGDNIGHHELVFTNTANGLQVDIKTDVKVKVLFVTAYQFAHDGHEIWQNGRLVRLWSKTNDDGAAHELNAAAEGASLTVVGDGKRSSADGAIVPASLWNENILRGGTILNTLTGVPMAVQVQNLGAESVQVNGQAVQAWHFSITGDLQRELWFDQNYVLVKVRFKGKDGSDIQYVLR
jgi:hypothetical protein